MPPKAENRCQPKGSEQKSRNNLLIRCLKALPPRQSFRTPDSRNRTTVCKLTHTQKDINHLDPRVITWEANSYQSPQESVVACPREPQSRPHLRRPPGWRPPTGPRLVQRRLPPGCQHKGHTPPKPRTHVSHPRTLTRWPSFLTFHVRSFTINETSQN